MKKVKKNKIRVTFHILILVITTTVFYGIGSKSYIPFMLCLILLSLFCLTTRLHLYKQGLHFSFLNTQIYIDSDGIIENKIPIYLYYWDSKIQPIHLNFREYYN